jgi:hypothetical protein
MLDQMLRLNFPTSPSRDFLEDVNLTAYRVFEGSCQASGGFYLE